MERTISLLGGVSDFPFPEVCEAWGVSSIGEAVWATFETLTPAMFITGTLDGLTPISNVEELRGNFADAGHLIVERMGHEGPGLWFANPSVLDLVGTFLAGGQAHDTIVAAPAIEWVMPTG